MSNYVTVKNSSGQEQKLLSSDDGVIQVSFNGDDYADMPGSSVPADAAALTAALDPATAALQGLMTPAQFTKLAGFDYDEWFSDQVALMHTQAPLLTSFRDVPIGCLPMGAINTVADDQDGLTVGGAIANAAGEYKYFSTSVFQTPKTTSWAMAWRGRMTIPAGGNFAMLGLTNAAHSHLLGVVSYGTTSATKYVAYMFDTQEVQAISTIDVDLNFHDFVMTFDGTTVKLFIDGTIAASETDLTGITDEPLFLSIFGTLAGDAKVARLAYGYIRP